MNFLTYLFSVAAIAIGAQCVTTPVALSCYALAVVLQLWRIAETIKEKRP